jgi:hypothetical protein
MTGDGGKKKMNEDRREKKTAAQSRTASRARETRDIFKQLNLRRAGVALKDTAAICYV